MGKIKKLIPIITLETAVILMLLSSYVFIFDAGLKNVDFQRFMLLFQESLYTIKYVAALITMYVIMRDKRSIVSGYIGIAYVIISGCFLIYVFFENFDFGFTLLENFFLFFDPLIIYLVLTIVYICFIAEKGNRFFLFFLTIVATVADLIVGSVYYSGTIHSIGIYSRFETIFLEVVNTDFYFAWFVNCSVFAIETILIMVFSKPSRKNKSEETEDQKEKDETIKKTEVFITLAVSLLISFLTIFLIFRPLIKNCNYNNYKDSFAHKTIELVPRTFDKLSKASPKKIMSKCPFETKDEDWTFFPKDNMFGLVGMVTENGDTENTIILAFADLKSAKNIKNTVINYKYLFCQARYGSFSFDNPQILEKNNFYYVKLKYDNRIIEPQFIIFDLDKERVIIDISSENIRLTYCNFGDNTIVRKYQNFDAASGKWEDITTEEEKTPPVMDIPHDQWTELQVDEEKSGPSYLTEGVNMFVHRYDYSCDYYNIYGEIETPQVTGITFYIRNFGVLDGDERILEDIPEDEILIDDGDVKLYIKKNGSYADITPEDATVEGYMTASDGTIADYTFNSSLLGELTEGEYKLEYGGYESEFTLAVQTFEAW